MREREKYKKKVHAKEGDCKKRLYREEVTKNNPCCCESLSLSSSSSSSTSRLFVTH